MTNFEDFTQEEDVDFELDDYNEIAESSLSIMTQGISSLVLLASFGRGATIVVTICLVRLVAYLLYKKWMQRRDERIEHNDEFEGYGQQVRNKICF